MDQSWDSMNVTRGDDAKRWKIKNGALYFEWALGDGGWQIARGSDEALEKWWESISWRSDTPREILLALRPEDAEEIEALALDMATRALEGE